MSAAGPLAVRVRARIGRLLLDAELHTGRGTLVLIGPNGAGKSSLLSVVLGLLPVESGRITLGPSILLDAAAGIDTPTEQRRLGYLAQDYALFPHLDARGNVEFALASAHPRQRRAERAARADALLRELGVAAHAERRIQALSGGERQRVALARALAVKPRALLLDEPLAALDADSRRGVRDFLATYLAQLKLPTLVVTHDPADARRLGDQIAVLERGRVIQTGTWRELCAQPASPFVERFIAAAPPDELRAAAPERS